MRCFDFFCVFWSITVNILVMSVAKSTHSTLSATYFRYAFIKVPHPYTIMEELTPQGPILDSYLFINIRVVVCRVIGTQDIF